MGVRGQIDVARVGIDPWCRFADALEARLLIPDGHAGGRCDCCHADGVCRQLPWIELRKSIDTRQRRAQAQSKQSKLQTRGVHDVYAAM